MALAETPPPAIVRHQHRLAGYHQRSPVRRGVHPPHDFVDTIFGLRGDADNKAGVERLRPYVQFFGSERSSSRASLALGN